jgi:hypothetical protein
MQRPEQARSGFTRGMDATPATPRSSLARFASERRGLRADGFEPPSEH